MWGQVGKSKKQAIFKDEHGTVLGKGMDFQGNAHFEGTVRIDCGFKGEIMADDLLIIGEHAVIMGTIVCGTIISRGRLEGDITATTKVQLLKPAVLIGNVRSPSFSMEEGVNFRGFSDVGHAQVDVFGVSPRPSENGRHDRQPLEDLDGHGKKANALCNGEKFV